jgi:hypothetical protein
MNRDPDDIVTQLRDTACCWRGNDPIAIEMRLAADEIERLRTQLEMWQDGNIMSESHHDEIKRLTAERDEARRMFCDQSFGNKHAVACELGWSCYPETKR